MFVAKLLHPLARSLFGLTIKTPKICSYSTHPIVHKSALVDENRYSYRTHLCGDLSDKNVGDEVVLCGWIEYARMGKFLTLRDHRGSIQILLSALHKDYNLKRSSLSPESVIRVTGRVVGRPESQINPKMPTGQVEILPDNVELLNKSMKPPFQIQDFAAKGENVRQTFRYLDIRSKKMQRNLRLRSKLLSNIRRFLEKNDFVEVETPTLFRSTPGGAKEFNVPSGREAGKFYTLPQSPQQLKQLLMVGGIDRYYQLARCYRDEPIKTDRQPEFSQIDLEMSFVEQKDVMRLTEDMVREIWPCAIFDDDFPVITHRDAVQIYGNDKPDLRLDMRLQNVSSGVEHQFAKAIVVPEKCKVKTSELIDMLHLEFTSNPFYSGEVLILSNEDSKPVVYPKQSTNINENYVMEHLRLLPNQQAVISIGNEFNVNRNLGLTSTLLSRKYDKLCAGDNIASHKFLWVTDFPLFEYNEDADKLEAVHHPFTSPKPEDLTLLETSPLDVRSQAYDLVLNGHEIGGGSIRIHHSMLQRKIFKDILKVDVMEFDYFLKALDYGAPPHGGIALGIDRIMAILCQSETIKDTIAFPKNSLGKDIMVNAPCKIKSDKKAHNK